MKLGITLPSFRDDAEPVARGCGRGEASGLDGVFAYDHLLPARRRRQAPARARDVRVDRRGRERDLARRGRLARRARDVAARAPRSRNGFDTVARISAPNGCWSTIGAGDLPEPRGERELRPRVRHRWPSASPRCGPRSRRRATTGTRSGSAGRVPRSASVAAEDADGWNSWGTGVERFASRRRTSPPPRARAPFTLSWGGLVVLADDDAAAAAKAQRLGAGDHVIVGGPGTVARGVGGLRRRRRRMVDDRPARLVGSRERADPGRGDSPRCADGRWYRGSMEFRRINALPPYVFGDHDALKIEARRAGEDVIDLGFGNPDIPSPDVAVEKLAEAVAQPAQPPLLDEQGHPEAAPRGRRPVPAQVRRRARLRDRGRAPRSAPRRASRT